MSVILEAGRWTPSKRRWLSWHRNPGLEIVHVVAGRTRWQIGQRSFDLAPGDVYYTLPWEEHGSAAPREPGLVINFAVLRLRRNYARPREEFEFHPAISMTAAQGRKLSRILCRCRSRALPAGDRLPWLLDQMVDLYEHEDHPSPLLTASLGGAAIAELAQRAGVARKPVRRTTTNDRAAQRVEAFLNELPSTCQQPWTLSAMATACGVGRTRFSQLVRQQTGDTPILALNRARIARAEALLRDSDQTITRIAHGCGFSSSQYFARLFREYTGQSATAFRQAGR